MTDLDAFCDYERIRFLRKPPLYGTKWTIKRRSQAIMKPYKTPTKTGKRYKYD